MRRFLPLLAVVAIAAPAQTLSRGDRDRALSELHATRKQFLDSIANLTAAQWEFKPAPERWSIAEIAEHIAQSEDVLLSMVRDKIMKTPAGPGQKSDTTDAEVLKRAADRSQKAQAPEMLKPAGRWPAEAALATHFRESRLKTIDYIDTTPDNLRAHFMKSPRGTVDGYQMILTIAAHTARHVEQINEVKADPKYPK